MVLKKIYRSDATRSNPWLIPLKYGRIDESIGKLWNIKSKHPDFKFHVPYTLAEMYILIEDEHQARKVHSYQSSWLDLIYPVLSSKCTLEDLIESRIEKLTSTYGDYPEVLERMLLLDKKLVLFNNINSNYIIK